ncbi:hypothetical protein BJN34_22170 [Cupriavidus necator]|uniref:Uncharacterized protein n=1 Tax=Cupriavidus necator TaxID=106590 RepID=A0A1U9UWS3_CUPNE|nr:hypothetical protein BJN34_22170 [Cupriavidus necator]
MRTDHPLTMTLAARCQALPSSELHSWQMIVASRAPQSSMSCPGGQDDHGSSLIGGDGRYQMDEFGQ